MLTFQLIEQVVDCLLEQEKVEARGLNTFILVLYEQGGVGLECFGGSRPSSTFLREIARLFNILDVAGAQLVALFTIIVLEALFTLGGSLGRTAVVCGVSSRRKDHILCS